MLADMLSLDDNDKNDENIYMDMLTISTSIHQPYHRRPYNRSPNKQKKPPKRC